MAEEKAQKQLNAKKIWESSKSNNTAHDTYKFIAHSPIKCLFETTPYQPPVVSYRDYFIWIY